MRKFGQRKMKLQKANIYFIMIKGAELAVDPSPVYKNSGGIYAGFKIIGSV